MRHFLWPTPAGARPHAPPTSPRREPRPPVYAPRPHDCGRTRMGRGRIGRTTARVILRSEVRRVADISKNRRCVPTMVGRAQRTRKFCARQPFLIGRKWPLLGAIPLVGAQRSSQTWHAAFPSTYTFRMEANLSAGLSCAQTKSICTKVGRQCQNHGIENGS